MDCHNKLMNWEKQIKDIKINILELSLYMGKVKVLTEEMNKVDQ